MQHDLPNAEEIAYWNDEPGQRWVRFQAGIDRAFAAFGPPALEATGLRAGEHVVDVGCGCGASTLRLAQTVGPTGAVLAIDVSQPMLARAEARARADGIANARFVLADAATHDFTGTPHDLAFSRFGVMFFDDPAAAFANIARAIRPGGRLVFVCWRDLAANPWFHIPLEAVRPHVPPQPKLDPLAPGPLALADPARIRTLLRSAGFADIHLDAFDADLPFGPRAAATELLSEVGPTTRFLGGANAAEHARAIEALDAALGACESDGEVRLGAGVWIVSAWRRAG